MPDPTITLLRREYGIQVLSLEEAPGGWCASAYRLTAKEGLYFLKAYQKDRPSTREWIARMDAYMPVVLWLGDNTPLGRHMACPLLTQWGSYKAEDDSFVYLLFPFVTGETLGDNRLSLPQIEELARLVACLHQYGGEIPAPTNAIRETFDTSFSRELKNCLNHSGAHGPLAVLGPYKTAVEQAMDLLERSGAELGRHPPPMVLCHTDLHGWNLIQGERLVLVDWEGLSLAPVEADLFAFTQGFFHSDAWEAFWHSYQALSKVRRVTPLAMDYYRLRRRLTDVVEFLESILGDNLPEKQLRESVRGLERECQRLVQLYGEIHPS